MDQQKTEIQTEKAEAEEILKEALPALEKARLALEDLDKNDITEIRSFATPPEAVQVSHIPLIFLYHTFNYFSLVLIFRFIKIVCECVTIIRGYKEISWKSAKGMMSDPNFLKSLQELNCNAITWKQVLQVKAHMKKSSKLDEMKKVNIFCELCILKSKIFC